MGPNFVLDKGYKASTAVIQFYSVTLTANDTIKQSDAAGQVGAVGICQETITSGDATNGRIANIRVLGISRAVVNGAVTRGQRLAPAATGKLQVAATTNTVIGVALTAASADGDQVDVLLMPGIAVVP